MLLNSYLERKMRRAEAHQAVLLQKRYEQATDT